MKITLFNSSLNSTTFINLFSTVLLQGITFFSTPVFTRLLGPEHYGYYSVFNAWVCVFTCVMGLGVFSSLGIGRYEFKEDYYRFRNTVLLFGTILSMCVVLLCVLLRDHLSNLLHYSTYMSVLVLIGAFSHGIIGFIQLSLIYEKRAIHNFFLSAVVTLSTIGLSIYCIRYMDSEILYMGRVYGTVIPFFSIAVIVWILFFVRYPAGLDYIYCKFSLVVGFPIVFHQLAQNILGQANRVMMQGMGVSNSEIGIYSLFFTLCTVLSTILNALNTSWCPFYYDDLYTQDWTRLKSKCKNYIELFSLLTVGFLLLSREVSYFMADSSFWKGIDIIPLLALPVYFTFMYQFPVNFELYYKQTKVVAFGTFITGALNIALNYFFIPLWGIYGASFATVLSYLFLFIMHYSIVINMKDNHFHLNINDFMPGIFCITIGILIFFFFTNYWWIRWLLGFAIACYEAYKIHKRRSIF